MNKRLNKNIIKILSGVLMSGFVVSVANNDSFAHDNVSEIQITATERATIKTGVVTATALNVRKTSSVSSQSLGGVFKGDKVEIVDVASNGWYKIKFKNGYGYVSNLYIEVSSSVNTNTSSETSSSTTVTYTGVTTTGLNIRSGGSTNYSVVGYFSKGTKIDIITKLSNGWYKVKFSGNKYGYVSGAYVDNVKALSSSNTNSTVIKTGTVNTAVLNVRSGSSTSNSKLGTVTSGTKVEIVEVASNGWYKIKFNGGYGYVCNLYVTTSSSSNNNNNSNNTNTTVIKTGTVNTAVLNVRSGSSTSNSKLGTVTSGTKVEIVEVASNGWYKIKFNGGYGYVSNLYVNIPGERTNLNNFLFVGDSFTVLLSNTIKSKNSNVYIEAKSGSMPSYWLNKVSSMPANSKVDGVVLLIGVNGAAYQSNKTDVKTLINKLSARYPNKTIYVQKIFPVGKNFKSANPYSFNQSIKSLNAVIEAHCKTVSNAKFIDTTKGFVDSNGYLINTYDGLHISSSYNNTFYNNILNAVKNTGK